MSELRFVRELGAEFERLEQESATRAGRGRLPSWTTEQTGRILMALAVAVPLAIVVLAISLVSHSSSGGQHPSAAPGHGLALGGGNCRTPARATPIPAGQAKMTGSDGMVRFAGGRVSGIPWQLRVGLGTELHSGIVHGRLDLGGREYGLCSRQSVPVPFGLINAGAHGIVYGYVANGAGSYRITVSAGATPLATSVTDTLFFILALPRPACTFPALSVTATATPVGGLPPDISRSLNDTATRFTTTIGFGDCRPHALVTAVSEGGQSEGRSPNAPLATGIAQVKLIAPPGSHSHAVGTVWELRHGGKLGINLFAGRLRPGRYGVWLLGPNHRATSLASVTVKHNEINGAYDLPSDAGGARQIVIAAEAPGQRDTPGRIVLSATIP